MTTNAFVPSIRLTTTGNWQELEDMVTRKELPAALADCLKELIACERHGAITPEAKPHLIQLVKEYLPNGIQLSQSMLEPGGLYDVVVWVPHNKVISVPNTDQLIEFRSFFKLVPKYPNGELRYPKDLMVLS
jgi:hypothetical protein